jgi:hypothetical protein
MCAPRKACFSTNATASSTAVERCARISAFTPQEAADAAAAICNLGLEHSAAPDTFLIDRDLVTAFEAGWSVLHRDASQFAAEQLISVLADVDSIDREIRNELIALRRTLMREHENGTPWRARDAAEILAMLDTTACIAMLGLLDECPVLPAALTALLDGRTTSVSPTDFVFIATTAQIADVRVFMEKLPELLRQ